MKKIYLFILVVLFSANFLQSQTINGVEFSTINLEYIKIVGINENNFYKTSINIDFGFNDKNLRKNQIILDENGNKIKFYSMIDALNFMSKFGYEYVDLYIVDEDSVTYINYILRKKH